MKYIEINPPRKFTIGNHTDIEISDCGKIELQTDELVTFTTKSGKEYDFVKKNWGFYATPSLNGRLKKEGFKSALVRNSYEKLFILVVEENRLKEFNDYLKEEDQQVVYWLDEM